VNVEHEGQGLGTLLLQDVIRRTLALGTEIGCRGLLVHAETPEARDFYLHLVPEFEASPTDEFHLFLLMKDIRKTLA
jgi:GNAT superfamily N-acetyltransferase